MRKKQNYTASSIALQRQLEANSARRAKMISGFSQFCSYSAADLMADGTVESIEIRKTDASKIVQNCKYLFYQLDEDLEAETEGGFKVELSFEEQGVQFCGVGLGGGGSNQSIVDEFKLPDSSILEMRRIMATDSSVTLGGTRFNIFKLVKLISGIKTKNAAYKD